MTREQCGHLRRSRHRSPVIVPCPRALHDPLELLQPDLRRIYHHSACQSMDPPPFVAASIPPIYIPLSLSLWKSDTRGCTYMIDDVEMVLTLPRRSTSTSAKASRTLCKGRDGHTVANACIHAPPIRSIKYKLEWIERLCNA